MHNLLFKKKKIVLFGLRESDKKEKKIVKKVTFHFFGWREKLNGEKKKSGRRKRK